MLAGVALKFVPVMVTVVPIEPEAGVKEEIEGKRGEPTNASPVIVQVRVVTKEVLGTWPVVV